MESDDDHVGLKFFFFSPRKKTKPNQVTNGFFVVSLGFPNDGGFFLDN